MYIYAFVVQVSFHTKMQNCHYCWTKNADEQLCVLSYITFFSLVSVIPISARLYSTHIY